MTTIPKTVEQFHKSLIEAKALHEAYIMFQEKPKDSAEYQKYREAADIYGFYYNLGQKEFGLAKSDMRHSITAGRKLCYTLIGRGDDVRANVSVAIPDGVILIPKKAGATHARKNSPNKQITPLEQSNTVGLPEMTTTEFDDLTTIPSITGETWKDIIGYEGYYAISNMGRVYALPRSPLSRGHSIKTSAGQFIKQQRGGTYGYVRLYHMTAKGRVAKDTRVAILVTEHFMGGVQNGIICTFNNGDMMDCRQSNIKWIVPKGTGAPVKTPVVTKTPQPSPSLMAKPAPQEAPLEAPQGVTLDTTYSVLDINDPESWGFSPREAGVVEYLAKKSNASVSSFLRNIVKISMDI